MLWQQQTFYGNDNYYTCRNFAQQMNTLKPYTSYNEAYGAFTTTKEHLQMNSLEPYTSDNEAYGVFTKEHLQESCYETIKRWDIIAHHYKWKKTL